MIIHTQPETTKHHFQRRYKNPSFICNTMFSFLWYVYKCILGSFKFQILLLALQCWHGKCNYLYVKWISKHHNIFHEVTNNKCENIVIVQHSVQCPQKHFKVIVCFYLSIFLVLSFLFYMLCVFVLRCKKCFLCIVWKVPQFYRILYTWHLINGVEEVWWWKNVTNVVGRSPCVCWW